MVRDTTVQRVTNRVWGIFSSLDHGIAENNNRRASLRAYIASLAPRSQLQAVTSTEWRGQDSQNETE